MFLECQFQLRNKKDHEDQCDLIKNDDSGNYSKEFGINRNSALNDLEYFHVCNGSLIPDIMHDVLEGMLQYEAKLMLQHLINTENYFTLDMFNTKLENLELGTAEFRNRPCSISQKIINSDGNSLKQNGQCQIFMQLLDFCSCISFTDVVIRLHTTTCHWGTCT